MARISTFDFLPIWKETSDLKDSIPPYMENKSEVVDAEVGKTIQTTVYPILFAISGAHLLNDLIQQSIPLMYPVFK